MQIRWKQRFENFQKAFFNLQEVTQMNENKLSNLEKEGVIQRFKVLIELSWKTMKDFLESEGFEPKSPKETVRQALSYGLINEAQKWLEALQRRNVTSHTYDAQGLEENLSYILEEFYPLVESLHSQLKAKL